MKRLEEIQELLKSEIFNNQITIKNSGAYKRKLTSIENMVERLQLQVYAESLRKSVSRDSPIRHMTDELQKFDSVLV